MAWKPAMALENWKECIRATARLTCGWTAGAQGMAKDDDDQMIDEGNRWLCRLD